MRSGAVDGRIDFDEFERMCGDLGIGDVARGRIEAALPGLGLTLGGQTKPSRAESPESVADERASAVLRRQSELSPRVSAIVRMARRYANAGTISPVAFDGVVRISGLEENEIEEFSKGLRGIGVSIGRSSFSEAEEPESELASEEVPAREGAAVSGVSEVQVEFPPDSATPKNSSLGKAVDTARKVLERDRWNKRPEKDLLDAQAEVGLAALMRGDRPLGSPLAEADLAALEPSDERRRAFDAMVLHNQRLVYGLALKFEGRGVEREDLFQHGMRGLMHAAVKFDGGRGLKFSTYAIWWIRQAITRAIADEGALIRLPVHFHEKVVKVGAAERALNIRGRRAGAAEVAVHSGLTVDEVEQVRRLTYRTDSLDREVRGDTTLLTLVGEDVSRALPSPEAQVLEEEHRREVRGMLSCLATDREREVIERRMGWTTGDRQTLDTIGEHFGVTRERIRQIEKKALETLRETHVRATVSTADPAPPAAKGKKKRRRKRRPRSTEMTD
ncbi:hypothetical protein GCM10009642_53820 [Nocardiopsis metallicus]